MTILTKYMGDKSQEKIPLPLAMEEAALHGGVIHGSLLTAQQQRGSYSDVDTESMIFNRPQNNCVKSLLLFLIAICVMLMGVVGGYTLYRSMYSPSHSNVHYRALCEIPYGEDSSDLPRFYARPDDTFAINWRSLMPLTSSDSNGGGGSSSGADQFDLFSADDRFFHEEIEVDSLNDDEGVAKIEVPNFKDGRRGRFMHDFKENQSAIIDTITNRCFIMPLDRDTTLPPSSFIDLMQKMGSGYYNIDTERVRRQMHVVTPRITDMTLISERIANECFDMKVYMLENHGSGVSKRSAEQLPDAGKFAEFMGKGVIEYDLSNIAEVAAYEANEKKVTA